MRNVRIIPRLDIKGANVIKGVHLECLRVVGDPELIAKKYYNDGADEIIYMDVVASLYGRRNLIDIVEKVSSQIFIPLTAGGGVCSLPCRLRWQALRGAEHSVSHLFQSIRLWRSLGL